MFNVITTTLPVSDKNKVFFLNVEIWVMVKFWLADPELSL